MILKTDAPYRDHALTLIMTLRVCAMPRMMDNLSGLLAIISRPRLSFTIYISIELARIPIGKRQSSESPSF